MMERPIVAYAYEVDSSVSNCRVPTAWSGLARRLLVEKFCRRAGVPLELRNALDGLQFPLANPIELIQGDTLFPHLTAQAPLVGEDSAHQVFTRLVLTWAHWGLRQGHLATPEEVKEFVNALYDDLYYQKAAPNSPQWFNTGLAFAYQIHQPSEGSFAFSLSPEGIKTFEVDNYYEHPQAGACFISTVKDSLFGESSITEYINRETRLFRHGSGSGANLSFIRGENEPLTGGGKSSGVLSFHKIADANAGGIKSGGVSRRAAKMAILDIDHPDVEAFIDLKMREEAKAAALVIGSRALRAEGYDCPVLEPGLDAEIYQTVGGQNANNSISIPDAFMESLLNDGTWDLIPRKNPERRVTRKAKDLWNRICKAAWASGDPGVQFVSTINRYNTVKTDGPIRASNPCSEFLFLDDSACNLASINLLKVLDLNEVQKASQGSTPKKQVSEIGKVAYRWTTVLDITVGMSQYPSESIARNSGLYRPLGLGYSNLGALILSLGLPYDSARGRKIAEYVTILMTEAAYQCSADLAKRLGPYPRWSATKDDHAAVLQLHEKSGLRVPAECYQGMRNAQSVLIAPTGTIGLVMDCDTTGIEPDFALVKYKTMVSGGGTVKIVNQSVPRALGLLGYGPEAAKRIQDHILQHHTVIGSEIDPEHIAVFDCANDGDRSIEPMGHVRMLAAVQPHLDGGISKTVNLPMTATPEELGDIYIQAWRMGVKCVAVFRDQCKISQPLNTGSLPLKGTLPHAVKTLHFPRFPNSRRALPSYRNGGILRATIGGQSIYIAFGEYPDGQLGEVFVTMGQPGSAAQTQIDAVTKAVSIGLQHGTPLEVYVDAFVGTTCAPNGLVLGHPNIKSASSPLDFIFRHLGYHYCGRRDLVHQDGPQAAPEARSEPVKTLESPQKGLGYTGEACPSCGKVTLVRNGTCQKCLTCGATTGCS